MAEVDSVGDLPIGTSDLLTDSSRFHSEWRETDDGGELDVEIEDRQKIFRGGGSPLAVVRLGERDLIGTLVFSDRPAESPDVSTTIEVDDESLEKLETEEETYVVAHGSDYHSLLLTRRVDAAANFLYALTVRSRYETFDELLEDGWDESQAQKQQVSFVFAEYVLGTSKDETPKQRRREAQGTVANAFGINKATVTQYCGPRLWDRDGGSEPKYHDEFFDPALSEFEGERWPSDSVRTAATVMESSSSDSDQFNTPSETLTDYQPIAATIWQDSDTIDGPTEIDPDDPPDLPETDLCFPDSVRDRETLLQEIDAAIRAGDHLILTGPPGSGKTKLADDICDYYADDHNVATATSDWTTFDTVGGYRPARDGDGLRFVDGLFLDCFDTDENGKAKNEWLVVDELNRADVDKAFGSLFTVLTGENVELPFLKQMQDADSVDTDSELRGNTSSDDEEKVKIIGDPDEGAERQPHEYRVPSDWRLIATMNAVDKASLYRMSYAFVRRFSFVTVPVPGVDDVDAKMVKEYLDTWVDIDEYNFEPVDLDNHDSPKEKLAADTALVWKAARRGAKPFGPGVIEDFVEHALAELQTTKALGYDQALAAHVLPQFEGREQEVDKFLSEIENRSEPPEIDGERDTLAARQFAASHLGVDDAAPGGD